MVYTGANYLVFYDTGETDIEGNEILKVVGAGVKVGTYSQNYNLDKYFGIGDRVADGFYSKGFEGSISVDYVMVEDDIVNGLWYADELDTCSIAEKTLYIALYSGECIVSSKTPSGIWKLNGVKFDSVKYSIKAGEYVAITLDGKFKSSEYITDVSGYTFNTDRLYSPIVTFANAHVTFGTGFDISNGLLKSVEVNIKHGLEKLLRIGSLMPEEYKEQKLEVDASLSVYMDLGTWSELTTNLVESSYYIHDTNTAIYPSVDITITFSMGSIGDVSMILHDVVLSEFSTSYEDANVVEGSLKMLASYVEIS